MPSYKTHSIHGELLFPNMENKIEINKEDFKTFCIGPDLLIATDSKIFNFQHSHNVKDYFMYFINEIKSNKLYENSEIMAFLYGQLDHYVLDAITHPFIYYFTKFAKNDYKLDLHGLMEMWIDNYMCIKYNKNQKYYYIKNKIEEEKLKTLINDTYLKIYNLKNEAIKYDLGIKFIKLFDVWVRRNGILIAPTIMNIIHLGDITYRDNIDRVLPFLNLECDVWFDPETGEKRRESFEDLWYKSMEIALQMFEDVNHCIYLDKPLNNAFISNNVSFNTGLPCEQGQNYTFARRRIKNGKMDGK